LWSPPSPPAKPAELPVQLPTKYEMVVNLKLGWLSEPADNSKFVTVPFLQGLMEIG
jgi:hypothetical protein